MDKDLITRERQYYESGWSGAGKRMSIECERKDEDRRIENGDQRTRRDDNVY